MPDKRFSIGIIGGGIAGLYCAWRLAPMGHSVTVFECLNRFGGRIETLDLEGYKAECGPMRFELRTQPLFEKLADELGITFSPFNPTRAEDPEFPRYILKQNEKSMRQLKAEADAKDAIAGGSNSAPKDLSPIDLSSLIQFSHLTSSLDLLRFGVYRILNPDKRHLTLPEVVEAPTEEYRDTRIAKYADSFITDDDYNRIRTDQFLEAGGPQLHTVGFWNALAHVDVLSPHAVAKIRDFGTFYHLMPENPSASEWAIFWLRLFKSGKDKSGGELSRIEDGVRIVVDRLVDRLTKLPRENVDLRTKATVIRIVHGETLDKVRVTVDIDHEAHRRRLDLDFDHVILALPKSPLRRLAEFFPQEIRDDIEGVIGFPLLKVFLVTDNPWWKEDEIPDPQYGAHLVPTREVHYFPVKKDGSRKLGMIMLYTDRPATAYWQPYVHMPHERAQVDRPDGLKDALARQVYGVLMGYFASKQPKQDALAISPTAPTTVAPPELEPLHSELLKILVPFSAELTIKYLSGAPVDFNAIISAALDAFTNRAAELLQMPEAQAIEELKQTVTRFAIRDWSQPPFGAACHAWAPGVHVPHALKRLQAFSLLGRSGVKNLHVCGEAYSDYQGFIEGALRSAQAVLQTIQ